MNYITSVNVYWIGMTLLLIDIFQFHSGLVSELPGSSKETHQPKSCFLNNDDIHSFWSADNIFNGGPAVHNLYFPRHSLTHYADLYGW